jgi:hypothetical protein
MSVLNLFLLLCAAALAWGVVSHLLSIVRLLRSGRAIHHVVTLKSGVSQPYDHTEQITREEQPALFWKIVRREARSLIFFLAFIALVWWSQEIKAWLGQLF